MSMEVSEKKRMRLDVEMVWSGREGVGVVSEDDWR